MASDDQSGLTHSFDVLDDGNGVDPEQLMGLIAEWVTRHTTLTKDQTARLKDMLKAHASRLEVFVHIAADQRARMLAKLFPWSDRIDRELFDPKRIQGATTEELLRAADVINRRIEGHVGFLKDMIERPQPQFVQETERQIREIASGVGALASLPPDKREELRSLLTALAKQVGQDDSTDERPTQEVVPGRPSPAQKSLTERAGGNVEGGAGDRRREPDYAD